MVFKKGQIMEFTSEHRKNMSKNHRTKNGFYSPLKGKTLSEEHKIKIGESNKGKHFRQISPNPVEKENHGHRAYNYSVIVKRLLRPDKTCMSCGKIVDLRNLHIHHTDIFNRNPETLDISSLKLLCPKCHKQADMEIWKEYKEKEVA